MARFEGESVVNALIPHIFAEDSGVSSQPGHSHPNVVVHLEHLLLVPGQVRGEPLQAA